MGLTVEDFQNVIMVKENGLRFVDETKSGYDFYAACMAWSGDPNKLNGGGPVWAIFDQDAVTREKWDPKPPFVDTANGYFFSADTLAELARKLTGNKYQKVPMSPAALQATVTKYNSYVDMGKDPDFNKPTPRYKIQSPPFYAAWATPILHDTYAGLRVNEKFQVMDIFGHMIPGFYCAGESAGGFALHGLGRAIVGGYIAASNAAKESKPKT